MPKNLPWNKGKSIGQQAPFSPSEVQTIKQILSNEGNLRDLALFSVGIDTMLRAADLLRLTVSDVTDHQGQVIEQFTIFQQKTGKGTVVALLPYSQRVLSQWIKASKKLSWHYLFTGVRKNKDQPITEELLRLTAPAK